MAAGAALPALFLTFAAMVLLLFASISAPTWDAISFMNVTPNGGGQTIKYGVFGSSASDHTSVGYSIPGSGHHWITTWTKALILIPIACALSGIAFLFGLCGAAYHRIGTILLTLTSALALLTTLVGWIISMVVFGIARNHLKDNGNNASYHNAEWLVLGAFIALTLAFCTGAVGSFGHYRRRRAEYPSTY